MKTGSLCAGYGGIDLAVHALTGAEPAWFFESAGGPSKVLAHHYPTIPNHGDLTQTDWATVEPVDVITAGWPCQPWSRAGSQKGRNDDRAIWPAVANSIRRLQPRFVFLENVSAIVKAGELGRVIDDLAEAGYDTSWDCIPASDAGAPHKRERCFIFAEHPDNRGWRPEGFTGLGYALGCGRVNPNPSPTLTDPSLVHEFGRYAGAIEHWAGVIERCAPDATCIIDGERRLAPVFVEWMMGLPENWVTGVPDLSPAEQIRILGNGVVPQQAALTYGQLMMQLYCDECNEECVPEMIAFRDDRLVCNECALSSVVSL